MAATNRPLPTEDQCYALSDEQCRKIQEYQDPGGTRANRDWERAYQPELIRQYMSMRSFKPIAEDMKPGLNWSYKTYENRYRDWGFPLDRIERERVVRKLYAWVTGADRCTPSMVVVQSTLPIRQIQPQLEQSSPLRPQMQAVRVPLDFFFPHPTQCTVTQTNPENRVSVSTTGTSASGSSQSSLTHFDDSFSDHRASIATTNSSVSAGSQYSLPSRLLNLPQHNPSAGTWNDVLRVIPCGYDHTNLLWSQSFPVCLVCGFSRWHSLMLHARSMEIGHFAAAMTHLRHIDMVDFAGNHPIHYLMAAGAEMEYFTNLFQWAETFPQNVFGQNPLHVLNPLGLGEQVISLLEWFKSRENPPGVLLTQRDINCRTPLHAILQYPLERHQYQMILKVFPLAEQQLRTHDNRSWTATTMMNAAAIKIKAESVSEYTKIQAGITEAKRYLLGADRTQETDNQRHGFHNIARGARGYSYAYYYECRICKLINAHSSSYLDQMKCACAQSGDRNGPDETGMTPAHALVTIPRCNDDENQTPETASQTTELFKLLIPTGAPNLREALHVLDAEGHSLVFNIAVRGFDEILEYVLQLEDASRRRSMVNTCLRDTNGMSWSVLAEVQRKMKLISDMLTESNHLNVTTQNLLVDMSSRLTRVEHLLLSEGAELSPSITTQWRIC